MKQLVKVDKTGNFKIPQSIRNSLKLKKNDTLLIAGTEETIVIKKIKQESLNDRFNALAKKVSATFKARNVSKADIDEAVRWARK